MESYCCVCDNAIDACKHGHTKCLKIYLTDEETVKNLNELIFEKVPDDEDNIKVYTLLHVACERGHGDCVKILLQYKNLKLNVFDDLHRSPLRLLCSNPNHREKIIKLLLEDPRTDVNSRSDSYYHDSSILFDFMNNSCGGTKLSAEIINLFLQRGASTDGDRFHFDGKSRRNAFDRVHNFNSSKFNGKTILQLLLESGKITEEIINRNRKFMTEDELKIIDDWMMSTIKEPAE